MKLHNLSGYIAMMLVMLVVTQPGYTEDSVQIDGSTVSLQQAGIEEVEIEEITFKDALQELEFSRLSKLGKAIDQLAGIEHPQVLTILQALLNGNLYKIRDSGRLVIVEKNVETFNVADAENGKLLGQMEKSVLKKINLTNRIRSQLRVIIGQLQLDSDNPALRLQAVKDMGKSADANSIKLLTTRAQLEQDEDVLAAINLILALQDLKSTDRTLRLAAIKILQDKSSLEAMNRLQALTEKDEQGNYIETDEEVRKKARSALNKIQSRLQFNTMLQTVFFGLSLGAVLVLAAIGLTITFGVMGVINMAHGELMMLGAYTTYVMQQLMPDQIGLALILSIPAAFMIAGLVGIGIERGIIRFLYGRPLETLLATFGVSLFLQQTVRSIFSPLNRSVSTPEWMSGSWQINEFLAFTWNRFYIIIFCLLVFSLLLQILKRTSLGLEVRAVSQNRDMAKAMGIPTSRVDALTFGLGSGIAGVAGVALSQITNVGPNLGQSYIVDSFMVVVFGGVGNLWGTLVAGFSLGIANKMIEPFAGAVLAKILVLVFIILFIQKRPRGMFPQKGRAAEG